MSTDEKPANAAPKADGDKSPTEIRAEIDRTREELGDTVEALAEKTDVKAQAKAKVEDVKDQARAKVQEAKSRAGDAAPESPREGFQQAQAYARQNPRPLAIATGAVVLFLLWRIRRS